MKKIIHYLNLTNGIEILNDFQLINFRFMRIQSTACEQKRWDFILRDLDYDFLMNLALGNPVIIYDFSAKKAVPRSVYQGVEWIRYILNRVWFDRETTAYVKNHDCTDYFREKYKEIDKSTFIKLKYFKKFLHTNKLNIYVYTKQTKHDGDFDYFNLVLEKING